jgi:hypothetical protein
MDRERGGAPRNARRLEMIGLAMGAVRKVQCSVMGDMLEDGRQMEGSWRELFHRHQKASGCARGQHVCGPVTRRRTPDQCALTTQQLFYCMPHPLSTATATTKLRVAVLLLLRAVTLLLLPRPSSAVQLHECTRCSPRTRRKRTRRCGNTSVPPQSH